MRLARTVLAVVLGLLLGSVVNMGVIALGGTLVPPPGGLDTRTADGLQAAMPLFQPRHFAAPFLAHALGTLVGAAVAVRLSPRRGIGPAIAVGGFFLLGGLAAAWMLPAPAWFIATDLLLAYGPMAWLGARIARRPASRTAC